MTSQALNRPVDVLAVLDPVIRDHHSGEIVGHDEDVALARDAFVELVACLQEIPEREVALPKTKESWALHDESVGWSHAFFSHAVRQPGSDAYRTGLRKGYRARAALARICGGV